MRTEEKPWPSWVLCLFAVGGVAFLMMFDAPWNTGGTRTIVCDTRTNTQVYVNIPDEGSLSDRYDRQLNGCSR